MSEEVANFILQLCYDTLLQEQDITAVVDLTTIGVFLSFQRQTLWRGTTLCKLR